MTPHAGTGQRSAWLTSGDLPALTGLRFVAAMMILMHHMTEVFNFPPDIGRLLPLVNGVSFFFILSGFILTHVYRGDMDNGRRRKFYLARFARIWPSHIACMVLLAILVRAPRLTTDEAWIGFLTNFSLLQAWIPNPRIFFSLNAVSWTLSVEAFFYLLFPFIAFRRNGTFVLWMAGSFACVVVMALLTTAIGAEPYDYEVVYPSIDAMMYINPVSRLFEFILGIAAARVWLHWASWLNDGRWKASLLQVFALGLVALAYTQAFPISALAEDWLGAPFAMWLQKGGLTCLFSAFLIFSLAANRGIAYRLFALPPLVYLGKISFALYLSHQILVRVYVRRQDQFVNWNDTVGQLAFVMLAIAVAAVLHHLVEEPCRRWVIARYTRKQARTAALSAQSG